jgi:hypothetical protein
MGLVQHRPTTTDQENNMQAKQIKKCETLGDTHIQVHPTVTLSLSDGMQFPENKYTVQGFVITHVDLDGNSEHSNWTKGRAYKSLDHAKAAAERAFGDDIEWKSEAGDEFLTANVAGQPHIKAWAARLWKKRQQRIARVRS